MKKLLIIGMLGLAGTAGAVTWEYATFDVWTAPSEKTYFWSTPDADGKAAMTQGKSLAEINVGSNCNVKPRGQHVLNDDDLFNCFGTRGWELVTITVDDESVVKFKTYWFKRAK